MDSRFYRKSRMDRWIDDCEYVIDSEAEINRVMYSNEVKRLETQYPELLFTKKGQPASCNEGQFLYSIKKKAL